MKVAITSLYVNITYDKDNHRGLETYYFRDLLMENGYEVDLIGKRGRTNNHLDFFIDYQNCDLSQYDAVFIQLTQPNFFGGVIADFTIPVCEHLTKYKGKIFFMVNDPSIKPTNPAIGLKRKGKGHHLLEDWDRILEEAEYLFPGKDITKFLKYEPKKWRTLDWFTYIFKKRYLEKTKTNSLFDDPITKEWDLVYYGDKRGPFREKQVQKYFPDTTNNVLIGYKTDKVKHTFMRKMKHNDLIQFLDSCKASLIIGDKQHLDNVITYRFYETLASNCLAAIQIEYDPNRELIEDPVLKDTLYVESKEDVIRLCENYSEDLLDRQKRELQRIFDKLDTTFKI